MDKSGAEAYVYAKASGILGKSFIGSRAQKLFEVQKLSDLWTLLFKSPVPMVPEFLLAQKIEEEAFKRLLKQYKQFVSIYDKPQNILYEQLGIYEAENLKEVAAALCSGESQCPKLIDLENFTQLDFTAWPDISKITENSTFSWYNKIPGIHEQQALEFKIDIQVIKEIWNSLNLLKGEEAIALKKLYLTEFTIKNIIWALRLKINYKMDKEKIVKNLMYVGDAPDLSDPISCEAIKILDKPIDEYSSWEDWKYFDLINPHTDGEIWNISPSWIENKGVVKLNKMASLIFHQYPMSSASFVAWYKIKDFELRCIRTAVEALRLNINNSEAMAAVGLNSSLS